MNIAKGQIYIYIYHIYICPFAMFMCRLCTFSYMYLVTLLTLDSLSLADSSLWRGRVNKDGYGDQIVTRCGCVTAFQDTFTVHVAQ